MEKHVLDLLYRHEPLHIGAIIERSDAHPSMVEESCMRLFQQGYLTTDSCGVYRLTQSGCQKHERTE
ncbi:MULTISPECIES: hypothetical protein [Halostella]|uniref:hypothetical protein n=1 Tax=Halostella TaxID=1843185 RepID=UPI001081C496|nr:MULTISPECIES: hypothetical protein [Halostella]